MLESFCSCSLVGLYTVFVQICLSGSDEFDEARLPLHGNDLTKDPPTCLHWVRMSSLRVHDNAALSAAMGSGLRFKAVLIYDPWFESGQRFGLNRWGHIS